MMANARTKASLKYNLKNYERIEITVPKGHKKMIKDHASPQSVNSYIKDLIYCDMGIIEPESKKTKEDYPN